MAKKRKNVTIWQPANVYDSAKIGNNVSIGMFAEIGEDVVIGDNTRIGSGAFIPKGVFIEDDVFIGPRVVFCNDKHPKIGKPWKCMNTLVCKGASIGANCTILPGIVINRDAVIGAGSIVTKNILSGEIWYGNPAKPQQKKY